MTRSSLMMADVLMMIITWGALAPVRRTRTTPLHAVLLRDGTAYFVGKFLQNAYELTQIVLSAGSAPLIPYAGQSYVSSFAQQIACVLITRFLVDLQAAHQQTTVWEMPSQSQTWFALGGLAQSTASGMTMAVAPADSARVPDAPGSWKTV
ncbi:hypothetical protein C8Q74DRAFT_8946 [Fomes fomentarius]|nr:hypothetical protein C8Q74DRAFT_8946 [Fomes fomentarius]